jgi:hypothetical protein
MFLAMCCIRMAQSQYDDTIKGKLQVMYNEPNKFRASLIAGTAIETQGTEGGVGIPSAFLTLRLKPVKPIILFGTLNHQFQWAWKWQNIKDTRNWEAGMHIFLNNKRIEKWKTFTAGTGAWNYDFTFPVKVAWNVGITGNYRQGSAVFNSGTDKSTEVKFRNHHDSRVYSLEKAAIPYTFSEISAGFIVSTATRMKLYAHLPDQTRKSRRMKTYTEFRIEGVFMPERNYDSLIVRKPAADATKYFTYDVIKGVERNWGLRFSGFFSRKWYSMRFEAGISPGITYRFAGAEGRTPFDRSYLLLGFGIGWM